MTDTDTDRQTNIGGDGQTDKHDRRRTYRLTCKETDRQTDKQETDRRVKQTMTDRLTDYNKKQVTFYTCKFLNCDGYESNPIFPEGLWGGWVVIVQEWI